MKKATINKIEHTVGENVAFPLFHRLSNLGVTAFDYFSPLSQPLTPSSLTVMFTGFDSATCTSRFRPSVVSSVLCETRFVPLV
jgi:hypothetical protein